MKNTYSKLELLGKLEANLTNFRHVRYIEV